MIIEVGEFEVHVDENMYDVLSSYHWFLYRGEPVRSIYIPKRKNSIYRAMCKDVMRVPNDTRVKYIDGDKLNVTRDNLKLTTHQEQLYSQKTPKNNRTGFKGVSYKNAAKKYEAYIKINGKKQHLGYFDDVLEAAKRYDEVAVETFGSDANINGV